MGFILIGRHKTKPDTWHNMGPYEFANKSDFGNLARIRRDNANYELKVIDKQRFMSQCRTP